MFLVSSGFSQGYINNGASTVISSGTYLVVDGNFVNNTNVANGNVNLDGTIKVNGNWINNASAGGVLSNVDNDGTVLFNGTTTFSGTSTAPFDFENLSVAPSSTVTINANVPVTVNTNIANSGTINVKSIAAGNGSLLVKGVISGSGLYKVDRYLSASKWHLVSSPITNALSGVFLNIYLKSYNEATNTFGALITPTTIPMPVGQGFSVWTNAANEIRTFSGTVNNGTVTPAVQLTGAAGIGTGWNLIGNPYPSAIDWNAASGWTKTGIANSVYVWNNNQYATFINGSATNGGSRYIAMEQGFFVQTTSASANISMNNNVRVHNTVGYLKTDEEEPADILRVKVNMGVNSDEAVIAIRDNGSDIFNFETDAVKLPGSITSPQMHTIKTDNSQLAISALTQVENVVGKYVYIDFAETGIHQLLYTHTLTGTSIPRLFDTKTLTVVEPNSPYSFQAIIGESSARFQFIESLPMSIDNSQINSNLTVWESNNNLFIVCANDEIIKQVCIYSVEGNLVSKGVQSSYDISHLSKAMYLVKVITNKQIVTKKIIRK